MKKFKIISIIVSLFLIIFWGKFKLIAVYTHFKTAKHFEQIEHLNFENKKFLTDTKALELDSTITCEENFSIKIPTGFKLKTANEGPCIIENAQQQSVLINSKTFAIQTSVDTVTHFLEKALDLKETKVYREKIEEIKKQPNLFYKYLTIINQIKQVPDYFSVEENTYWFEAVMPITFTLTTKSQMNFFEEQNHFTIVQSHSNSQRTYTLFTPKNQVITFTFSNFDQNAEYDFLKSYLNESNF